jgi:hypothetical protein
MKMRNSSKILGRFFFIANAGIAVFVIIGSIMIILSGSNEILYQKTGQLVPTWSNKIKFYSALQLFFSVLMVISSYLYLRGIRNAKFIFFLCIVFFTAASFSELRKIYVEFGADYLSASAVKYQILWFFWLITNLLFFKPINDTKDNKEANL